MLNAGMQPPAIPGLAPTTAPEPEQPRLQQERRRLAQ